MEDEQVLCGFHSGAYLCADGINGGKTFICLVMPEGPAITAWRALDVSADFVDGALKIRCRKAPIWTNTCRNLTIRRK